MHTYIATRLKRYGYMALWALEQKVGMDGVERIPLRGLQLLDHLQF